jgi:hypothetical protein
MMMSRVPLPVSLWLIDRRLITIVDLPPKDPHEDEKENEEDEDEDDEANEEPAVIREPDEC